MLKIAIFLCAVLFVAAETNYPWSDRVEDVQTKAREQIDVLIMKIENKLNLIRSNEATPESDGLASSNDDRSENDIALTTSRYTQKRRKLSQTKWKSEMMCKDILRRVIKFRKHVDTCGDHIETERFAMEAMFCAKSAAATATWLASQID